MIVAIDLESALLGFAAGLALALLWIGFLRGQLVAARQAEKDARLLAHDSAVKFATLQGRIVARMTGGRAVDPAPGRASSAEPAVRPCGSAEG